MGVRFVFGIDARQNLKDRAEDLPAGSFSVLKRPARYQVKTTPRGPRKDHKTPIVVARQYETIRLKGEEVAEFDYRPVACDKGVPGRCTPQAAVEGEGATGSLRGVPLLLLHHQ